MRKLPKFEKKHLFLIANEFFDALPIEQYLRKGDNFFKRTVQVSDGKLEFGLEEKPTKNYFLDMRLSDTSNGDIVELNLSAAKLSKI